MSTHEGLPRHGKQTSPPFAAFSRQGLQGQTLNPASGFPS